MSADRSFTGQLLHRRVPQIVGMYIAATWMMVEIGEWVTERLGLAGNVTLFLFILMVAMLPSVVIVAYNHGAPGRDRWTLLEKTFLPINLLVAVLAIQALGPAAAPGQGSVPAAPAAPPAGPLVAQRELIDEQGQRTVVEVPAVDYFERIAAFPWRGAGESDNESERWLDHGIPLLLEKDIDRSPFLSIATVLSLSSRDELAEDGYADGRGLPRALRLKLARERNIKYLVEGAFSLADERVHLTATLLDVDLNEEVGRFETEGTDLLAALDEVAGWLAVAATPTLPASADLRTDLALSEHFTESIPVARLFVEAKLLQFFDNDYAGAIERLTEATTADPSFAAGFMGLAMLNRQSAKAMEALTAINQALALDYKLSAEERFLLKAERYGMQGDSEKAVRVLEMLTEVQPYSAFAFRILGANYMVLSRIDEAERAFLRVLELDPSSERELLTLADISQMSQNFSQAERLIKEYLAANPDQAGATRKLGALYAVKGDLEAAQATYERALILANDPFPTEMAMARLDIWQSRFVAAEARLDRLIASTPTPRHRVDAGIQRILMYQLQGRISDGLAELDSIMEPAQQSLSPIELIFSINTQRAGMQASLGRHEEALAEIDAAAAGVQPPMDGFFNFARIAVMQESEDVEGLRQVLDDASAFATQYQFPFLEPFVQAGLGKLANLDGRPADGAGLLRQAISTFRQSMVAIQEPYVAEAHQTELARSLRLLGELEEARSMLREHLRRYPADGLARLEYVRLLRASGDEAGARDELDQVAALWADADPEFIGLRLLARLEGEATAYAP